MHRKDHLKPRNLHPAMTFYDWIIAACWLAFAAYWIISAVGVKRNVGMRRWGWEVWLRAVIIVVAIFIVRIPALRHVLLQLQRDVAGGGMAVGLAGAALCVLGVGFAIWARSYLGRNWGMPMSRKEDAELITGGPYAYVRHPIYGGILVAMLGSAIGGMVFWLLPLVLCLGYFVYSARNEEKLMREQFPEQYPAYMQRTRMFVPFIF
jgi:protein-S-isoprenylcysteine O-methyltransferase Ste14